MIGTAPTTAGFLERSEYGATGKTLALQSLALSAATGKPIWDHFDVRGPLRVVHLDYEQGSRDTRGRYQRLRIGHGFEASDFDRRSIRLASMPRVYLNSADAELELRRISNDAHLVIIDSLRAAAPGADENTSEMRAHLDLLTQISETTATAFVVIHHAGKPKEGTRDQRTMARGSSAIFDAAGCVLQLDAGPTSADPKRVTITKAPASAEGAAVGDFALVIEDVRVNEMPTAGVRVQWRPAPCGTPSREDGGFESHARRVLRPFGASQAVLGVSPHAVASGKLGSSKFLPSSRSKGASVSGGGPTGRSCTRCPSMRMEAASACDS